MEQIELLQKIDIKTDLRISFEKTEYMDSEKTDLTHKIEMAYRIV